MRNLPEFRHAPKLRVGFTNDRLDAVSHGKVRNAPHGALLSGAGQMGSNDLPPYAPTTTSRKSPPAGYLEWTFEEMVDTPPDLPFHPHIGLHAYDCEAAARWLRDRYEATGPACGAGCGAGGVVSAGGVGAGGEGGLLGGCEAGWDGADGRPGCGWVPGPGPPGGFGRSPGLPGFPAGGDAPADPADGEGEEDAADAPLAAGLPLAPCGTFAPCLPGRPSTAGNPPSGRVPTSRCLPEPEGVARSGSLTLMQPPRASAATVTAAIRVNVTADARAGIAGMSGTAFGSRGDRPPAQLAPPRPGHARRAATRPA